MNHPESMSSALPLVKWVGGKRRLAKAISPLFPEHKAYIEPFCGGAALFFMRAHPCRHEIINDINGDLINLYRVVQHHPDEFFRQFEWTLCSRQLFNEWQGQSIENLTDIQRAARFYYLQNLSFGGKVSKKRHFAVSVKDYHGLRLHLLKQRLAAAHKRLIRSTIECLPWQECIQRYDRPYSFFYLDPPYWKAQGYSVPFKWAEYEALADCMRNLKGKALLSINDHSDIRALFAGFNLYSLQTTYCIAPSNHTPARELIITNYKTDATLPRS